MPLKYTLVVKILKDLDFNLSRSNWSHFRYEKNSYWVTIPFHDEFAIKTAKSILKDISKISWIEYKDLLQEYNIKL